MSRFAALLLCCAFSGAFQEASRKPSTPYKDGRRYPNTFEGPGREEPEPEDVREVLIGYYGPSGESHAEGGLLWQGAMLAIEEANREGGYKDKPFRLVPGWSEDPWRAGASLVTRMVFKDRVWAIIGSIDGAGTHLAEQVVVKAMVSLVNPVATDRGIHMAGVPWVFSVVQGDDMHSSLLARALRRRDIVIVSATDHDSRAFARLLKSGCGREAVNIKLHLEFDPARADLSPLALSVAAVSPETVVIAASAHAGARVAKALRESGFGGAIFGGPWFGRASFAGQSGAPAEGALFSWVGEPVADFSRRFAARFSGRPDYAAACAYDSVRIVIAAIREAGLNRARIRDALAKLSPYEGVSGRIEWDEFGQNRRPPVLGIIRNGQPVPAPAQ